MTDKDSEKIDWDFELIKIKIENLTNQIQESQKSRKKLIFLFGTIIIAFWAIMGTLVAQLIDNKSKINVCTKYDITTCFCDCNLSYEKLMSSCSEGTNNCQSWLCNIPLSHRDFSIYQFLLSHNTFNTILFSGILFTMIIILVWRWTENYFYFEETEKQEQVRKIFTEIPILFDIRSIRVQKILKINPYGRNDPLERGNARIILLILLSWICTLGLTRILPNVSSPHLYSPSNAWIVTYLYCPLPISWLYILLAGIFTLFMMGAWYLIDYIWGMQTK